MRVCLSAEGAKNVSWPWLSPLRGWGSLPMTSTGKFVYIYIFMYKGKVLRVKVLNTCIYIMRKEECKRYAKTNVMSRYNMSIMSIRHHNGFMATCPLR